ncbi:MAG: hypothetical protein OXG92_10510 [Chloroflexi bacterium]|nr:hypothetical protein [Chloroflexota bacterium]MCY3582978.1 hypothetical protein [Chloroflexota bacterium]MCY3716882.1 hypothetical protein [Chloroflexota bacterium]MDE2650096.1 hypothetical protein [Chloroflexota bacterium]MXX84609.1 hypothetical protein [Chloroflexota bacterium]
MTTKDSLPGIGAIDLNVAVIDSDFYARHAINAYLAWDRRTRVVGKFARLDEFHAALRAGAFKAQPRIVVVDASDSATAEHLRLAIDKLQAAIPGIDIVCLAPFADGDYLFAAAAGGAKAYLLKADTRIHIAWALCHVAQLASDDFLISAGLADVAAKLRHARLRKARSLAQPRLYKDMTPRIRQAIELYAVEGMPQKLVAHEMGIEVDTVRDYIRQAYDILDALHPDDTDYPLDMHRQEIAFMRITALAIPDVE